MGTLHVWTADSEEWVVAESAQDACERYCAYMGFQIQTKPEEDDRHEFGTHPSHWKQLADDKVFKLKEECPETHKVGVDCPRGCDDNFILHHAKTCAEWASERADGERYLGSANW